MKRFDWTSFLRQHPLLSAIDARHLDWLLGEQASTEHRFEAGELIVREGDIGDSIFLIGSGSVEAVLSTAADETVVLSTMHGGDTFGEMGLFERHPRSASVRAREACVILEVRGDSLRRIAQTLPDIEFKVLLKVSERLRSKNEQILALHLKGSESASRAKDEVLAMLGHELRNPVGAIATAVHVLERTSKPDDPGAPLRAIIARQTRQLTRLLDDLFDVSKLVSGKITLHRRPENLKATAERVVTSFAEAGRSSRHRVTVAGDAVMVEADPDRLEQMIANLLDNALKYTPAGGRVELEIAADGHDAVLRVRDSGAGMAPEMLPRVFDLFVQATQTLDRATGGLGIGLTVVKRLVELHGGTVSASSAGVNRGSEFVVRLPRLLTAPAISADASDPALPRSRSRHVVLIEDNRDFRHGLRLMIESWGHRVEEAGTGRQGLEVVQATRPDVVLVDLGLPDLDGYEVAAAVRSMPGGDRLVLIAVTGYGAPRDRRRSKEVGFDAHFTKPVDPQLLERVIASGAATNA